jgi:hypothetical protein
MKQALFMTRVVTDCLLKKFCFKIRILNRLSLSLKKLTSYRQTPLLTASFNSHQPEFLFYNRFLLQIMIANGDYVPEPLIPAGECHGSITGAPLLEKARGFVFFMDRIARMKIWRTGYTKSR